ncbi:MAG TPA: S16 family serine protease, partial [Acidimicrobiales bacterium]|nr:S16 family serine protease [Acidimicrobiales bacterium]
HLGYEPYLATGVGMIEVQGPAEGLLTTNDVITAIATDDTIDSTDWIELNTSEDLISKLQTYFPGDTVVFRVESVTGANQHQIPIVLGSRPDNPDAAFLGISVQTRIEDAPNMPFSVHFDTGAVGGNSAGLALTLSVLDLVTPGELTGGLRVATTGTISLNGDVGPIGGIVQKTITARRSGVDLFIVPTIEYQEAIKYAKGLNVVGVDTLDQALNALAEAGGNALNLSLSNN